MGSRTPVQYRKAVVIAHGKSERLLASYIYTNLHLPITIFDRKKGSCSIQINGLLSILSRRPFINLKGFADEFAVEYDKRERKLKNFKLFIIMDTDDCSDSVRDDYITGKLFESSCLKDYIVPIYNIPDLENVMIKAGIMPKRISDSQKGSFYSKVFPINHEPFSNDSLKQIKMFSQKIANVKETNLMEFVEYCLSLIN